MLKFVVVGLFVMIFRFFFSFVLLWLLLNVFNLLVLIFSSKGWGGVEGGMRCGGGDWRNCCFLCKIEVVKLVVLDGWGEWWYGDFGGLGFVESNDLNLWIVFII